MESYLPRLVADGWGLPSPSRTHDEMDHIFDGVDQETVK
jgi:hypothetical protein